MKEKAAEEAALREAEEKKAEEQRVRAEEKRKKKEALKKAEEEERTRKELEKQTNPDEDVFPMTFYNKEILAIATDYSDLLDGRTANSDR